MLLALVLTALAVPQDSAAPLVDAGVLSRLRGLTSEVAKTGDGGLVERMRAALVGLGDERDELARLVERWERTAASARPSRSTRTAVASRLERELQPLVAALADAEGERRTALARWIVELDSAQPDANVVLGHVLVDGLWLTPEEELWRAGAARVASRVLSAGAMDFHVEHEASESPVLRALGVAGSVVRCRGLEVHARMPLARLERILVRLLRAAALSHALLKDDAPLPRELPPRRWVLLDTQTHWRPSLDEALAAGGLTSEQHAEALRLEFGSVLDTRGWRLVRWRTEADFAATMLYDVLGSWMPPDAQPCLRVGHLQWVCLTALGTSMPLLAWRETDTENDGRAGRSTGRLEDELLRRARWRATRRSFWGSRSWMIARVREGRDPPWARAMLSEEGRIRDENLLKTTLVCAMLQEEGTLPELVQSTRGGGEPVQRIEAAVGSLSALEARWKRWIDPEQRVGVLQRLRDGASQPDTVDPAFDPALLALNRARATALKDQTPEIPVVTLDAELSRAAALHARYLEANPEQKSSWPEVHEEFPGEPGYTTEGALAGSRGLIAFERDPEAAVRSFLGTFFHRLPLLDPGLFAVGIGRDGDTFVLDARSLVIESWREHVVVWPLPDEKNVPVAFEPEAPNPVPGSDMTALGYPVTVQLFWKESSERVELVLELFRGGIDGDPVACHVITPDAPLQVELAPENAWALVPKARLAAGTRYTARARWGDQQRVWSFTTGR